MRERARWWVELLVVASLLWLYDAVNNLAPLRAAAALSNGRSILSFERSLHIAPELTLDRWLAAHHTLGLLTSDYYDNAHFIVTFGLLGWLWWRRSDIYRQLRSSLVAINVIGLIVFWLYPVAPPRMLVSGGFTDVVAATHAIGSWHTGSLASNADQFAAMPSLHLAWALWCTLVVWRLSSRAWVRVLGALHPCVTTFAVLSTGNHYVLDVLAGVVSFALAVALVRSASGSVPYVTKLLLSHGTGRLAGGRPRDGRPWGGRSGAPNPGHHESAASVRAGLCICRVASQSHMPGQLARTSGGPVPARRPIAARTASRTHASATGAGAAGDGRRMTILRYLDLILLAGAVPVTLALGAPVVGVVVSAVAWVLQHLVARAGRRWIARQGPNARFGLNLVDAFGRIWLLAGAIVLAAVIGGRSDGLTAALMIFGAYSAALAVRLVSGRPRGEPQR